eukprot:TRINITY_DN4854_c0_g1_i2.p1 TRINITY_DN4854_c0_g1~~TRINITY_DN4854_c0_g1_i2.p1  ORF type:complete len:145 (+),score=23.24 TRINITY_DN4854_c0_g1_i2:185-619(+)
MLVGRFSRVCLAQSTFSRISTNHARLNSTNEDVAVETDWYKMKRTTNPPFSATKLVSLLSKCTEEKLLEEIYFTTRDKLSEPDVSFYYVVLSRYVQNNKLEQAMEVYHDMCRANVLPNLQVFSLFIEEFIKRVRILSYCHHHHP